MFYNSELSIFRDLNSNKISYIVEDVGNVFSALTQLQKLGIAFNHIKSINKNAFTGLSMLMELDLTGNNITSIQENAFLPLKGLNALKMNTSKCLKLTLQLIYWALNHPKPDSSSLIPDYYRSWSEFLDIFALPKFW